MLEIWKEFLLYNKGERRSIITLCLLLALSTIFFVLIPYLFPPKVMPIKITEIQNSQDKKGTETYVYQSYDASKTNNTTNLLVNASFDPNTVQADMLTSFGLAPKLIKTWMNYTSKGGIFKVKEDLQKLYGMNDACYEALAPYVLIPEPSIKKQVYNAPTAMVYEKKALHINLNSADTNELKRLPMIGSGRAKKMITYRNLLGGYVAVSQLKEVYGFNDSIYDAIKSLVFVEVEFVPNKIFINKMDNKEISKHPYFRTVANLIVSYRKEHGVFKNEKELHKMMALDEATILRIIPYINFDAD